MAGLANAAKALPAPQETAHGVRSPGERGSGLPHYDISIWFDLRCIGYEPALEVRRAAPCIVAAPVILGGAEEARACIERWRSIRDVNFAPDLTEVSTMQSNQLMQTLHLQSRGRALRWQGAQ